MSRVPSQPSPAPVPRPGHDPHLVTPPQRPSFWSVLKTPWSPRCPGGTIRRALILWICVFSAGTAIPSAPLRDLLTFNTYNTVQWKIPAKQPKGSSQDVSAGPGDGAANLQPSAQSPTAPNDGRTDSTTATKAQSPASATGGATTVELNAWQYLLLFIPLSVAVFVAWTPTNIALICCAGAVLGAAAQRMWIAGIRKRNAAWRAASPQSVSELDDEVEVPDAAAIVHGLAVFVGILVGVVVVQGSWDMQGGGPEQYLRLAGTATLFSIAAGANPNFMRLIASAFTPFSRAAIKQA